MKKMLGMITENMMDILMCKIKGMTIRVKNRRLPNT